MRDRPFWMIPILLMLCAAPLFAQSWTPIEQESINPVGSRDIVPQTCVIYHLDYEEMKAILWSAPYEYVTNPVNSNTIITVGLADGSADMFKIVKYDMMEALLAAQFPDMKTFRGVSVSDPYRTIRVDWTKNGFRAVISDLEGKTYIDPYQRNDLANRVVYYADSFESNSPWTCGMSEEEDPIHDDEIIQRRSGDCQFRSYRLALATTGEYSNFYGATSPTQVANVLSQVITTVNRVNEVYEAEVAVRFILIGNTPSIFNYDPSGDPYNGDACTQSIQNQNNTNTIIGSANYDVGHLFSVGSGGCATLGALCDDEIKATGATGQSPPTGNPFYIDHVAHELGHQLGSNHTFNGTAGSCSGSNRSPSTAYEPGSGSTLMAYPGMCEVQNIKSNSDDYFHARSLLEISNKVQSTDCATILSQNNSAPNASNIPNYTIPISTPFILTASASDANNDPLSYCWEQYDLEATSSEPPTADDIDGPLFRTFPPTASPSRYFPRLKDLTQNISPVWEVLPSVGRAMKFRMTVRDYHNIAGCTDEDDVVVTANANAGPFLVTSQNSSTAWYEGAIETITWDVANTTASPVNCANIEIRLSTDGGFTYPVVLAASEANDGSASVVIPPGVTNDARVMVKALNNIFFDINNTDISILQALPNFTLSLNPQIISECNDGSVQTIVNVGQFMDFTDPVTLSVINKPPGSIVTFDPQVVSPGGTSILTISNVAGLFGTYTPTVRGSSTTGNKEIALTINLFNSLATTPTLLSPVNNAPDAVLTPVLDWQSIAGVVQYEYQVAYDNAYTNLAYAGIVNIDKFQITSPLITAQQYYWRVRAVNPCGVGVWSSTFNFTTSSCFALWSSNVPVQIPVNGASTVSSVFDCPIDMVISDVNVINLTGTHSWMDDLKFTLIAPDASERLIWNQPCDNHDNFNINFDDEAANNNWPCPPTDGLTYKPGNTLSFFDGKHSSGIWTMEIEDVLSQQDSGSLSNWGLKVCGTMSCQRTVTQTSGSGTGSLSAAIACADSGDTIRLAGFLSGLTINVGEAPLSIDKSLVVVAEAPNINITGTGTRVFEIVPGVQVEFVDVTITAGTSLVGGAINNPGTVKIKNVTIDRNPAIEGATLIQNTPGAQLFVAGNCFINQ